jgi:hypothetical protein
MEMRACAEAARELDSMTRYSLIGMSGNVAGPRSRPELPAAVVSVARWIIMPGAACAQPCRRAPC